MDIEEGRLERAKIVARATERMHRAEQRGITTRYAIKYGSLAFLGVCGTVMAYFLGGESTAKIAESVSKVFAADPIGRGLPWVLTFGSIFYGGLQRKLRRDHIEEASGRFKALESKIDPERTSSNLTVRGDTAPEDRA